VQGTPGISIWLAVAVLGARGQTPSNFEVASIKLAQVLNRIACSGGPGTASPGIWRCSGVPLGFLITQAYDFQAYQFAPAHPCCRDRYDFTATVPGGATRAQFREMLRNLLVERFGLKLHLEEKEMPVFELTVGSEGVRLTSRAAQDVPVPGDPWEIVPYSIGKDGFPVFPEGRNGLAGAASRYRWVARGVSLQEIVKTLSFHLGRPVVDATGLKGLYDIDLRWVIDLAWLEERAASPELSEAATNQASGPSLTRAVEQQLGLKLNTKKGRGEIVVIDYLSKAPLRN